MTLRNKSARDSFRTTSKASALKRAFFGVANFFFFFPRAFGGICTLRRTATTALTLFEQLARCRSGVDSPTLEVNRKWLGLPPEGA